MSCFVRLSKTMYIILMEKLRVTYYKVEMSCLIEYVRSTSDIKVVQVSLYSQWLAPGGN